MMHLQGFYVSEIEANETILGTIKYLGIAHILVIEVATVLPFFGQNLHI